MQTNALTPLEMKVQVLENVHGSSKPVGEPMTKVATGGGIGSAVGRSRRQATRRKESMSLILDCAEAEFAQHGYSAATLAGVAKAADVDTALMRYYFGDKEQLFVAVVKRRGPATNVLRQKAMADYRAEAGADMTLEGIIEAFTRPAFELAANDEGWRNYAAIIGYVNSAHGFFHDLMAETFDEVSRELIADMRKVLPHARDEDLYWGYHFMTGAFTFSLGQTERIDGISAGAVSSRDFAAIARRLPIVVGAGIRAMCELGSELDMRAFNPMPPNALAVAWMDFSREPLE